MSPLCSLLSDSDILTGVAFGQLKLVKPGQEQTKLLTAFSVSILIRTIISKCIYYFVYHSFCKENREENKTQHTPHSAHSEIGPNDGNLPLTTKSLIAVF